MTRSFGLTGASLLALLVACGGDSFTSAENADGGSSGAGTGGEGGSSAGSGGASSGGAQSGGSSSGGSLSGGNGGAPDGGFGGQGAFGGAPEGGVGGAPEGGSGGVGASAGVGGNAPAGAGGQGGVGAQAGGGGDGGTGGTVVVCSDQDMDGQSDCDGDCDDTDPNNFLGNIELCGDLADNDCDLVEDNGCMGIGTFVSQQVGKDPPMGTGTANNPVRTINQGITNALTLAQSRGVRQPVFVANGNYVEKVVLIEGISLFGGYECNPGDCSWKHDPSTYTSAIASADAEGMLANVTVTRATQVSGFLIGGQNGSAASRGRATITCDGGTPTIIGNTIVGPDVNGGDFSTGRSHAILVLSPTSAPGPLIESNYIQGGVSGQTATGITLESPVWPPNGTADAEIRENVITGGTGRHSYGIAAWVTSNTIIAFNDISAGTNSTSNNGGAWAVIAAGGATLNGNSINTNPNNVGTCANTANWCGGIHSESATLAVTNNVVYGMQANKSAGVFLGEFESPAGEVVLNSNTIIGNRVGGVSANPSATTAALVLAIGTCNDCGYNAEVGSVRNNILIGNTSGGGFGVYEDVPNGRKQEPVAFENNLLYVTLTGGNGALYREFENLEILHVDITTVNAMLTKSGAVGSNISGNPLLDMGHRLQDMSPAIDTGTSVEAPATDRDGEPRPKGAGFDIGADEKP